MTKGESYDVREKDGNKDVRNLGKPVSLVRWHVFVRGRGGGWIMEAWADGKTGRRGDGETGRGAHLHPRAPAPPPTFTICILQHFYIHHRRPQPCHVRCFSSYFPAACFGAFVRPNTIEVLFSIRITFKFICPTSSFSRPSATTRPGLTKSPFSTSPVSGTRRSEISRCSRCCRGCGNFVVVFYRFSRIFSLCPTTPHAPVICSTCSSARARSGAEWCSQSGVVPLSRGFQASEAVFVPLTIGGGIRDFVEPDGDMNSSIPHDPSATHTPRTRHVGSTLP